MGNLGGILRTLQLQGIIAEIVGKFYPVDIGEGNGMGIQITGCSTKFGINRNTLYEFNLHIQPFDKNPDLFS